MKSDKVYNSSWTEKVKKNNNTPSYVQEDINLLSPPPIFVPDYLYIAETPTKPIFGVFSKKFIKAGTFIESAYAFPLAWRQKYQTDPFIFRYAQWGHSCKCNKCQEDGPQGFIGTGFSSIYNSSESENEANASLFLDLKRKACIITALENIQPNEEILIWFGQKYYDTWCQTPTK